MKSVRAAGAASKQNIRSVSSCNRHCTLLPAQIHLDHIRRTPTKLINIFTGLSLTSPEHLPSSSCGRNKPRYILIMEKNFVRSFLTVMQKIFNSDSVSRNSEINVLFTKTKMWLKKRWNDLFLFLNERSWFQERFVAQMVTDSNLSVCIIYMHFLPNPDHSPGVQQKLWICER